MASYSVSLSAIVWLSGIKVNDLVNELSIEPISNRRNPKFFENMYIYFFFALAQLCVVILFSRMDFILGLIVISVRNGRTAFRKRVVNHIDFIRDISQSLIKFDSR